MTSEEIVRDYCAAANKDKQSKILAKAGVAGVKMPDRIRQKKPEAAASGPDQEMGVYDRIEAILAALPEDASDCIRNAAANLTVSIFSAYVEQRLGKEEVF